MEVVLTGHGAYHLKYHIVWVTKYRRKILNPGVSEYIRKILPKLARSMAGVKVEQIGFDQDHLHLVFGNTAQIFNSRRYAFTQKPICVVIAKKIRLS